MTDKIFLQTTCATIEEAERIARHLVDRRLAACASISAPVRSIYRWRGAVEDAQEYVLTVKTRRDLFERVGAAIRTVHSYETPELIALPVVAGSAEYLEWMDRELAP
jgi:periplasmic divalent cation tolerance protein